ncbi:hypothetical protein T07_6364 [Trichinella nelsoni]|uniref:Uncharacterized protein n=1 Tax=Trichinella nelsoni TaxID=6336 RepID=A0A0V0SGC8_9BILA|nr:hypothetical protein T07_6364 [Trichinella nelsoni]
MSCFVTSHAPKINLPARQRLNQTRQKEPQEDLATISRKSGSILGHQKGYVVVRGVICHGDCRGLPRLRPLKFDFIFYILINTLTDCVVLISLYYPQMSSSNCERGRKVNKDISDRENSPETEVLLKEEQLRVSFIPVHLTGILTRPMENCPMNFTIHEWREMHIKGSGLNRTACKTIVKIYKRFHLVIVELQQQLKDDIAS